MSALPRDIIVLDIGDDRQQFIRDKFADGGAVAEMRGVLLAIAIQGVTETVNNGANPAKPKDDRGREWTV